MEARAAAEQFRALIGTRFVSEGEVFPANPPQ